jgi:hypothetical protein
LLAEHEIRIAFAREKNRALILAAGYQPAVVERLFYYDDDEFKAPKLSAFDNVLTWALPIVAVAALVAIAFWAVGILKI